ncbi:alpha/beta hydrolase [Streptomyces sp. SID10853]|uniref:alpha/beta hydrolase n=1 Tax=Streptomyces sp. SID10853 TaxID=2706028 RepID=UPI0013BFECEF|nr:alpha/beta hydrolase [Streptomyces sp. SID10853]NDZ79000.1 alpha/beta hydrolase [Streptomyces sp. SID10853]
MALRTPTGASTGDALRQVRAGLPRKAAGRVVGCAAAASLLLGGPAFAAAPAPPAATPSATAGTAAAPTAQGPLKWATCPAPSQAQGGGKAPGTGWTCATLYVPLDYTKPGGKTIPLALIRHRATGPGKRIGSLIYNFGGPGGSGVDTLPAFTPTFAKLNTRYDLVSFDPRGVGNSAPVNCLTGPETDALNAVDSTPDTPTEVRQWMEATRNFAAQCTKKSGPLLPYLTTTNVARDLDRIRAAVGDKKLNYYGFSYGTELGGTYAHLFPRKVGRAVLDGVMHPDKDFTQGALYQLKGFQLALDHFARSCVAATYLCPLHRSTPQGVEKVLTGLVAGLEKHPAAAAGGRTLNDSLALTAIEGALYSPDSGWPRMASAVAAYLRTHNPAALLSMADSMTGRDAKGHYSNSNNVFSATSCVDFGVPVGKTEIERQMPAFRKASPLFGPQFAWALNQCTYWPVKGAMKHMEVSAKGAPPILVIGNTGDPATPYGGAKAMAQRLGKGVGVLVTWKGGEGHCSYGNGSACIDGTANAYLLDGKVPAYGTSCS